MVARILLKKGCFVPEHSHHNEQISCVLEGALKFGIDGKEIVVSAGEVLRFRPHAALARRSPILLRLTFLQSPARRLDQ